MPLDQTDIVKETDKYKLEMSADMTTLLFHIKSHDDLINVQLFFRKPSKSLLTTSNTLQVLADIFLKRLYRRIIVLYMDREIGVMDVKSFKFLDKI